MSFRDKLEQTRRENQNSAVNAEASARAAQERRDTFFATVYTLANQMNRDHIRFPSGRVPTGTSLRRAAESQKMGHQLQLPIDERLTIVVQMTSDDHGELYYDCHLRTLNNGGWGGTRTEANRALRTREFSQVETWMAEIVALHEIPPNSTRAETALRRENDADVEREAIRTEAARIVAAEAAELTRQREARRQRREGSARISRLSPEERTRIIDLSEESDASSIEEE